LADADGDDSSTPSARAASPPLPDAAGEPRIDAIAPNPPPAAPSPRDDDGAERALLGPSATRAFAALMRSMSPSTRNRGEQ